MNTKHRKLVESMGARIYLERSYFHHELADSHFDQMNHQAARQAEDGSWVEVGHAALDGLEGGLDAPDDIPCGGMGGPLVTSFYAITHQIMIERGRSLEDIRRMNKSLDELIDEILAEEGSESILVGERRLVTCGLNELRTAIATSTHGGKVEFCFANGSIGSMSAGAWRLLTKEAA